jgi:hypothetical protein
MSKFSLLKNGPLPPRLFQLGLNLWPPYLASGIHVDYIARDYLSLHVSMQLHWFNRNYVGTHFGGSLYSMTDPFYMLMLIQLLGPNFIVWDKAATVRFRRPGKGRVSALFLIEPAELTALKEQLANKNKLDFVKTVWVKDETGQIVAEVEKVVYLRKK